MVAYALVQTHRAFLSLAEPTHVEWRALHSELGSIARSRGEPDAREARLLRDAERIKIWRELGEPSMLAYIERYLGYGPRCAYDRLRVARALAELPLVEKALAAGEIFYSVVRELTRVVVWETEEEWLAATRAKSLREVERMVSGRERGDLPGAPSKPELVRHVHHYEVSAETHALLRQARKALEKELGQRLDDDAFLAIVARRALTAEGTAPRERIAVMMCDEGKRATQDGGGAVVELPAAVVEAMECYADRMDAHGKVSRHIPEATRRVVLQRDHHQCRVPWCRSTQDLVPHHIDHHAHGGSNEAANLITMCWSHHRALHKRKLTLTMKNGEAEFERAGLVRANEVAPPSMMETALGALMGLGFKKPEAQSFLSEALAHVGRAATLKDLIHEALRRSPQRQ
jgi:hypothetical protein